MLKSLSFCVEVSNIPDSLFFECFCHWSCHWSCPAVWLVLCKHLWSDTSSWFLLCVQEEARVGHFEHQGDDSAGGTPGDPEHRQRHREQRGRWRRRRFGPAVAGPRPLLWGAGHLRGPLPERGSEPHRPHGLVLLHHAATTPTQNQNARPGEPRRRSVRTQTVSWIQHGFQTAALKESNRIRFSLLEVWCPEETNMRSTFNHVTLWFHPFNIYILSLWDPGVIIRAQRGRLTQRTRQNRWWTWRSWGQTGPKISSSVSRCEDDGCVNDDVMFSFTPRSFLFDQI